MYPAAGHSCEKVCDRISSQRDASEMLGFLESTWQDIDLLAAHGGC
jgi:hypothetical protein